MLDTDKVFAIMKSIAYAIETEQDAHDLIKLLSEEDWSWWINNTDAQVRWKEQPCVACKKPHRCGSGPCSGMCRDCYLNNGYNEIAKLSVQRNRARDLDLPYSLTLREWYATLDDFNYLCAYCLENPYTAIEHFLPISLGGGTTKGNCVPSCSRCNHRKRNHYPDEVANRFLDGTIERVRSYLNQFL